MTNREKKILILAAAVGAVFILTQAYPAIKNNYVERSAQIQDIQTNIEREQRLLQESEVWSARREQTELELAALEKRIIAETTVPLISTNIQRVVREYATASGISITSTKLAESMRADGWLLVEQELSIQTADQSNVLAFLKSIENSTPKLGITQFSLRRNRNQYSGTITVIGFSRTASVQGSSDV